MPSESEVCENTGVPEDMCPCPECLASIEPQSPPVAQVEVYRRALEHAESLLEAYVRVARHKKEKTFILETEVLERWLTSIQEALLTSKPEPVAPVRKWGVVGQVSVKTIMGWLELNPDIESMSVFFEDLSPKVQDALNGRKG